MINLKQNICLQIKEARRKAGLSQSEVAAEVGCKQSALSMFEQGGTTKLNDDVVVKLAKKFGIELNPPSAEARPVSLPTLPSANEAEGFCPNPHCPTNHLYRVDGHAFYRPDREQADPVGGKFCAVCGEVLEKHCPNCGAHLHEGAVCSYCGKPYVAVPDET